MTKKCEPKEELEKCKSSWEKITLSMMASVFVWKPRAAHTLRSTQKYKFLLCSVCWLLDGRVLCDFHCIFYSHLSDCSNCWPVHLHQTPSTLSSDYDTHEDMDYGSGCFSGGLLHCFGGCSWISGNLWIKCNISSKCTNFRLMQTDCAHG